MISRRRLLALGLGTAVGGAVRPAAARRASRAGATPRTLEAAVASFETLLSSEACQHVAAAPPARLIEYERGFDWLRRLRWHETWPMAEGHVGRALRGECAALRFSEAELTAYLIVTIAQRHGAPKLDLPAQLAPFREAHRREREAQERRDAACRAGKTCVRLGFLEIDDQLYFSRGSSRPRAGEDQRILEIAKMLTGSHDFLEVEIQGHAAAGEAHPAELALDRARAVVDALVRTGAPSRKLTAHGLGARFRNTQAQPTAGHDRERRADLILLRRERPLP